MSCFCSTRAPSLANSFTSKRLASIDSSVSRASFGRSRRRHLQLSLRVRLVHALDGRVRVFDEELRFLHALARLLGRVVAVVLLVRACEIERELVAGERIAEE